MTLQVAPCGWSPALTVAPVPVYDPPMGASLLTELVYRTPHPIARPGDPTGAFTGSAHVTLRRDLTALHPYLHDLATAVRCYASPPHATFLYEGAFCTLYARELTAAPFRSEAEARAYVHRLSQALEGLAERRAQLRPDHTLHQPATVLGVLRALPRTNCGECGYPTCMAFAVAVTGAKITPETCPDMPSPVATTHLYPVYDRDGNLTGTVPVPVERDAPAPSRPPTEPRHGLTDREIEVLQLLAHGATNPEIATALGITAHTVKTHVTHIFDKLTVDDRTQAAVCAVRLGLV